MSAVSLDHERIYQFRFQGVDKEAKLAVWNEISRWIFREMGSPKAVLDPAAGEMEFLRSVDAQERWGVDLQKPDPVLLSDGIRFVQGNIFDVELPSDHFEGAFVSNFLEHLKSSEEIFALLSKLHKSLKKGGVLAVMGPNFKYCSKSYFDCADHRLALTHISIEEFLFASHFEIERTIPKFLPYSFRSKLPASPALVRTYLRLPPAWKVLGKQFLVLARK